MKALDQENLKTIIKESLKEVLQEELIKLRLISFPDISKKEMRDIEKLYKKPDKKSVYSEKINL